MYDPTNRKKLDVELLIRVDSALFERSEWREVLSARVEMRDA